MMIDRRLPKITVKLLLTCITVWGLKHQSALANPLSCAQIFEIKSKEIRSLVPESKLLKRVGDFSYAAKELQDFVQNNSSISIYYLGANE